MIKIADECFLQVDIGGVEDLVDDRTPFKLEIKEQIGNILPFAYMTIVLPVEVMSALATEYAPVVISIGFHENTASYSKWQINMFDEINGEIRFALTPDRSYLNDIGYKVYDDQSANVIKKVVQDYFEIKDAEGKSTIKLTTTNNKMKWVQHGNSMKEFIDHVWLHSWVDDKLMMPVISAFIEGPSDKAGTFKLIDMTDHNDAIEITRQAVAKEDDVKDGVWLLQSLDYSSNSSVYNTHIGNRKFSTFDIETAETSIEEIKLKPIFTGDFNALNIKTHNDPIHSMSDNVHKNYAKAAASNLSRLSKFTDTKRIVVVDYGRISIGDVVVVTVPIHNSSEPNDIQSGTYIVAEVKQSIKTNGNVKVYIKELTLKRDANTAKENFKG
jgi:hypothetical protein